MTPTLRVRTTLVLSAVALLAAAAPAGAATITDPAGDGTSPDPGHDITQVDVAYDAAAGAVTATMTSAAAAQQNALMLVLVGRTGPDGRCISNTSVILADYLAADPADPGRWNQYTGDPSSASSTGPTTRGAETAVARTFSATAPSLAGQGYDCVVARISAGDAGGDEATGSLAAAPTPTPTPTPPPTGGGGTTPAPAPAAKLSARLRGIPATVRRGRTAKPKLTIRNTGNAASAATTVTVRSARGLVVKPRRVRVRALAPGAARTIALRVRVTRKARRSTPLVVAVRGGGLTATARAALKLKRPKPKPKPKPRPTPRPSGGGLPGTFWWWNEFTANTPFNIFSLRFYDNGYAYYRLPDKGGSVPPKCTSVTAQADEDGDFGAGCVRWRLDGTKLTFSDPRFTGTYSNGVLSMSDAEDTYKTERLVEPKAGRRFNVSYNNIETNGICGPFSFCSVEKSFLTLQEDGQFGLEYQSTSSFDTGGTFTAAGSYPPEARGTYEVLSGYRVRLSFADGRQEVVPFGLVDGTSAVDSQVKLVLGRLAFWPKDEND